MSQEIDYAKVIADLEARRAALDSTIAGLKAILGQGPVEGQLGSMPPSAGGDGPKDVVPGVFHGLSVAEAARKFLEMKKTKQKTRAMCEAMQLGGIESDSKNFYSNVYTTLSRNKDFIRRGKYWALAAWYPTKAGSGAPVSKPRRKGRRGRKRQKALAGKGNVVAISPSAERAETA